MAGNTWHHWVQVQLFIFLRTLKPLSSLVYLHAAFHYYCFCRCPGLFLLITQSQSLAYTTYKPSPGWESHYFLSHVGTTTVNSKHWIGFLSFRFLKEWEDLFLGSILCKNDFSHASFDGGRGKSIRVKLSRDYKSQNHLLQSNILLSSWEQLHTIPQAWSTHKKGRRKLCHHKHMADATYFPSLNR